MLIYSSYDATIIIPLQADGQLEVVHSHPAGLLPTLLHSMCLTPEKEFVCELHNQCRILACHSNSSVHLCRARLTEAPRDPSNPIHRYTDPTPSQGAMLL